MFSPAHGKVTTITTEPDGVSLITTESYYDGQLASVKQEYEIPIFSSKPGLLRDIIEALAVITSGETNKLTLEVSIDNKKRYRIIKKWSV